MFRPNPNIEIWNSKQIRISNYKMTQTNTLEIRYFCHWDISILVIVSYFVLRISNFWPKKRGFRSSTTWAETGVRKKGMDAHTTQAIPPSLPWVTGTGATRPFGEVLGENSDDQMGKSSTLSKTHGLPNLIALVPYGKEYCQVKNHNIWDLFLFLFNM